MLYLVYEILKYNTFMTKFLAIFCEFADNIYDCCLVTSFKTWFINIFPDAEQTGALLFLHTVY